MRNSCLVIKTTISECYDKVFWKKKTALSLGVTLFIINGTVKRTISHISNLQQPAVKLESESYVTTASRRLFIDSGNFFPASLGMCQN